MFFHATQDDTKEFTRGVVASGAGIATVAFGSKFIEQTNKIDVLSIPFENEVLRNKHMDALPVEKLQAFSDIMIGEKGKHVGGLNEVYSDISALVDNSDLSSKAAHSIKGAMSGKAENGTQLASKIQENIKVAESTINKHMDSAVKDLSPAAEEKTRETVNGNISALKENFAKIGELSGAQWLGLAVAGAAVAGAVIYITRPREKISKQEYDAPMVERTQSAQMEQPSR